MCLIAKKKELAIRIRLRIITRGLTRSTLLTIFLLGFAAQASGATPASLTSTFAEADQCDIELHELLASTQHDVEVLAYFHT